MCSHNSSGWHVAPTVYQALVLVCARVCTSPYELDDMIVQFIYKETGT